MKNRSEPALTEREESIYSALKTLRVPAMAEEFRKQALDPNADTDSFAARLSSMVEKEKESRYNNKFRKIIRKANLRYPDADIDQSIYEEGRRLNYSLIEKLAKGEWVKDRKNLLITGMTSSGKSYLTNALCIISAKNLHTVHYIRANRLMMLLESARMEGAYLKILDTYNGYDLLAIDDFGLMDLDIDKCRDLFEIIDGREGRKSTIVVSQLPIKNWFDLFRENTYADATLARLCDKNHSYRLEMNGRSMRKLD